MLHKKLYGKSNSNISLSKQKKLEHLKGDIKREIPVLSNSPSREIKIKAMETSPENSLSKSQRDFKDCLRSFMP